MVLSISFCCHAKGNSALFLEQRIFGSNTVITQNGIGWMFNKSWFHLRTSLGFQYDRMDWTVNNEYSDDSNNNRTVVLIEGLLSIGTKITIGKNSSICFSGDIGGEIDHDRMNDYWSRSRKNNWNFVASFSTIFYRNIHDIVLLGFKLTPASMRIVSGDLNLEGNQFDFNILPSIFLALPL